MWHICHYIWTQLLCMHGLSLSGYQLKYLICVFVHAYIRTAPRWPLPARVRPSLAYPCIPCLGFSCRIIWSHHACRKCLCLMTLWDSGKWCLICFQGIYEIDTSGFWDVMTLQEPMHILNHSNSFTLCHLSHAVCLIPCKCIYYDYHRLRITPYQHNHSAL